MATVSLDQSRARFAWQCVRPLKDSKAEAKNGKGGLREEYHSIVRSFPSMLQSAGIGQSVAFLMAKAADKRSGHAKLLHHLTEWLLRNNNTVPWSDAKKQADAAAELLERLLDEQDPAVWWRADEEAIEFSLWLKRFSESIQEKEKS